MIAHSPTPRWRVPLYALLVLLAVGLVGGLAGCGGGADEGPTQQEEQQQEQEDQQDEQETEEETPSEEEPSDEAEDAEQDEGDTSDEADEEMSLVERGQQVAQANGCLGCHSTDGSQMTGPTWQGLFGREVTLSNGETVTADAAYITESIRDPQAKIVEGFSPAMPSYGESQISADDVEALIAYIRSLSDSSDADGNGGDE